MKALKEIMRPHLLVFGSFAQYKPFVPDTLIVDPRPYLFCTYIKPGFLHILAFCRAGRSSVKAYLVDSLPLALNCESHEDMKNRLRAAIALFTLQNEVVKISEAWGSICWPVDILADEHEAVVEVTGICSPTPSETIPDYEEIAGTQIYIDLPGTCLEDEPYVIAKQVAQSIERVTPWLAQLDCTAPPSDSSLEPWD
ncbi:hypothetical protein EIP86_007275 [Pleurotus ostreatoroseus]|nr:hypothetical protein EIP86_007275 [Pleurotus ostreatoroseus]